MHVITFAALAWVLVACDARLSSFDQVDVEISFTEESQALTPAEPPAIGKTTNDSTTRVGEPSPSTDTEAKPTNTSSGSGNDDPDLETDSDTDSDNGNPEPPTVTVGIDLSSRASIAINATSERASSFEWTKHSGPGVVTFSSATAEDTQVSADTDGTYILRLTVRDTLGRETFDELSLTWDTTPPTVDAGADLFTNSTAQPSATVTGGTWYQWSQVSGSGQVTFSDTAIVIPTFTAPGDGTYILRLTAGDALGNTASDELTLSRSSSPPASLQNFTGSTGDRLGSVKLTIDLPADPSLYDYIDIRRDNTFMPPDCNSGTSINTIADFSVDTFTIMDDTDEVGGTFSYRACIYDLHGNLDSSKTASNVESRAHILFVSSSTYTGSFPSGLAGADIECKNLAQAAPPLDGEAHWRAVLSSESLNVIQRIGIYGPVKNVNSFYLDGSAGDFWDGTLSDSPQFDENGDPANLEVWSGSTAGGNKRAGFTCNSWLDGTSSSSGRYGESNTNMSPWLDANSDDCNVPRSIYCISQYDIPAMTNVTTSIGATSGSVNLILDFPNDTSKYQSVEIFRDIGGTVPSEEDCTNGISVTSLSAPFNDRTVIDNPGAGTFSYRVCALDIQNTIISSHPIASVVVP